MKIVDFQVNVGTPYFMSPELLRNETGPTKASDVYAFGIMMFEGVVDVSFFLTLSNYLHVS